jgi:hypothetical protein
MSETSSQYYNDILLAAAFFVTTCIALKRMIWSYTQGGVETTVVTAFYSLILVTALARFVWFVIPSYLLEPTYIPGPVLAFSSSPWLGTLVSEFLLSLGSLSLFSIFILILVYWSDILKKYFYPGVRRNKPMSTFLTMVLGLFALQASNMVMFLLRIYSSDGMIVLDSIILGTVSLVCVAEISIFSHRFRTVLRTLGAINQVSTESQVKRIVWITVTGNIFFLTRAATEITMTFYLALHYKKHKTFSNAFDDDEWDTYILVKHWSEVAILCLMLYILQSRFNSTSQRRQGYQKVPDADPEAGKSKSKGGAKVNPGASLNV